MALAKDTPTKKILNTREAAAEIGVSPRTLEKWRLIRHADGSQKGPLWVDVEGQPRYRRKDIEEYLEARTSAKQDEFVA